MRNVISGHFDLFGGTGTGVFIQDPTSNNNLVQGNLIGTDANGMAAVPNYFGIVLMNGTQGNQIGVPRSQNATLSAAIWAMAYGWR